MTSILDVFSIEKKHEKMIYRFSFKHNYRAFITLSQLFIFCCFLFVVQNLFFPHKESPAWTRDVLLWIFGGGVILSIIFCLLFIYFFRKRRHRTLNTAIISYSFLVVTIGASVSVIDCFSSYDMTALFVSLFAVSIMLSAPYRVYIMLLVWVVAFFGTLYAVFLSNDGNQGLLFTLVFLAIASLVGGIYLQYNRIKVHLLSLRLESSNRALRAAMIRDPLTGAYNRLFLDEYLDKQLVLSRRYGDYLSLLLLDIDHFKRVNDALGHQTGDIVLKSIVSVLTKSVRGSDIVARYGGEEFIVILPRSNYAHSFKLAEKLRNILADTHIECVPWPVTVSIGVGMISPKETVEMAFARIDAALYLAKQNGRNRVEGFEADDLLAGI